MKNKKIRVPSFIIKGKTPLIEILKKLGVNFKEEKCSATFINHVTPCPMPRHESKLLAMTFEYGKKN